MNASVGSNNAVAGGNNPNLSNSCVVRINMGFSFVTIRSIIYFFCFELQESRAGNVSSLSKLQQLTNGLDIVQPCNTPPAASLNLTPSPNHHPHNTMTPPPASHLVNQNRNLPTPPSAAQIPSIPYHKYHYSSNISHIQNPSPNLPPNLTPNLAPNIGSRQSSRNARNTPSANLISPYGSALNGYRMTTQQPSGYISNSAAGFINNPGQLQITNMANVMNMQSQYQDPAALQRAAAVQQNSMYSTYPYMLNANPMRR